MDSKIDRFRQGIFSLRTNFGELAQLMLKKDMGFMSSDDNSYDLKDGCGNRIEVKFSRAYKKEIPINESNVIDICSNDSIMVYRSSEAEDKSSYYDCNIQQLKPDCFDFLYYGVFFSDKIVIFCVPRSCFPNSIDDFNKNKKDARKKLPGYALQHKGGKECQFHIKRTTYKHHKDNYYVKEMTYEQLFDIFAK